MDQFGVVSPVLKAKARTPQIPAIELLLSARKVDQAVWLGATVKPLEGEEYSAFGVGKNDGGIQLLEVPEKSAAAAAGLAKGDVLLSLNGTKIAKLDDLFAFQCSNDAAPVKAAIVRSQQARQLDLGAAPFLIVETANSPDALSSVSPQSQASLGGVVTANQKTNNDPISVLTDGELALSYGPVFGNGIANGAYKLDLGSAQPIAAVNTWSCATGPRDQQRFTVYASASESDPGWNIDDAALFVPLGTVDTRSTPQAQYRATSLRAKQGSTLGTYRWFVWCISPISDQKENTAIQELGVEIVHR
jgi:membrane-associated protease RseP (regulator of RpoE activity)